MSNQHTGQSFLQKAGLAFVVAALLIFTGSLLMSRFVLSESALREQLQLGAPAELLEKYGLSPDYHADIALGKMEAFSRQSFSNTFSFSRSLRRELVEVQQAIKTDLKENKGIDSGNKDLNKLSLADYKIKSLIFPVTKASSTGFVPANAGLVFWAGIGLGLLGALFYFMPQLQRQAGIRNDHVYHSSMKNRGWLGITFGIYLIGFYILLYFFPQHVVNWVLLVDPLSRVLNGNPADQWFLYGFLYTLVILIMGLRMIIRYRHSPYQMLRTGSVMFFQLAFAFMLPQLMALLNQPAQDLKNIWPLDYSFFFDYRIRDMISAGTFGLFMLVWGIALVVIGVPLFTFFYGKRWYCSWVCGCGGLAETLGDPYRQLSDKSLIAWQIERWMIHAVLVFAVVMTGLVLATYFQGSSGSLKVSRWLLLGLSWAVGGVLLVYHRRFFPKVPRWKLVNIVAAVGGVISIALVVGYLEKDTTTLSLSSYQLRNWYGFYIGAGFAGVVGTGFYPLMGNRVWCRFGCPLAAYLGLVQRLRSRFRITTNGGQCISCGNCSTYCEMGIDVRWYAQRGQDIVRSSCVGCGICSAVCPRGVLRLENSAADVEVRAQEQRALHISHDRVELLS